MGSEGYNANSAIDWKCSITVILTGDSDDLHHEHETNF